MPMAFRMLRPAGKRCGISPPQALCFEQVFDTMRHGHGSRPPRAGGAVPVDAGGLPRRPACAHRQHPRGLTPLRRRHAGPGRPGPAGPPLPERRPRGDSVDVVPPGGCCRAQAVRPGRGCRDPRGPAADDRAAGDNGTADCRGRNRAAGPRLHHRGRDLRRRAVPRTRLRADPADRGPADLAHRAGGAAGGRATGRRGDRAADGEQERRPECEPVPGGRRPGRRLPHRARRPAGTRRWTPAHGR